MTNKFIKKLNSLKQNYYSNILVNDILKEIKICAKNGKSFYRYHEDYLEPSTIEKLQEVGLIVKREKYNSTSDVYIINISGW